jgi:hypothetical protein
VEFASRARTPVAWRKSLWVVEGARHDDFLSFDPAGYESHVLQFLNEMLLTGNR